MSNETIGTATLVHVYGKRVWIESDLWGSRHVVVQHDAPGEEPFTYCSFHYDYRHTCNSGTMGEARRMALALGATEPVEERHRGLPPPTHDSQEGK
jgi:hypothetical protein